MTESNEMINPLPAPSPKARRLTRAGRVLLAILALVFVVYAGRDLARKWQGGGIDFALAPVLLSHLPLISGAVLLAWGWKRLVERMAGQRVPTGPAIALNLESQLARYVPGKVGVPMIRMAGAASLGVSAAVVGSSLLVEILSFVAVGATFSLIVLKLTGAASARDVLPGQLTIVLLGCCVLATLLLVLLDRRHYPNFALRLIRAEGGGPLVPAILLLVHVGYWTTWLLHGYLILRAVGAESAVALLGTAYFALAPIVGFLALVTPGGLGVREAVFTIGLTPLIGPAPALAATILSRAVSIVSDVVAWLATRALVRRKLR